MVNWVIPRAGLLRYSSPRTASIDAARATLALDKSRAQKCLRSRGSDSPIIAGLIQSSRHSHRYINEGTKQWTHKSRSPEHDVRRSYTHDRISAAHRSGRAGMKHGELHFGSEMLLRYSRQDHQCPVVMPPEGERLLSGISASGSRDTEDPGGCIATWVGRIRQNTAAGCSKVHRTGNVSKRASAQDGIGRVDGCVHVSVRDIVVEVRCRQAAGWEMSSAEEIFGRGRWTPDEYRACRTVGVDQARRRIEEGEGIRSGGRRDRTGTGRREGRHGDVEARACAWVEGAKSKEGKKCERI
ncbi:hypothetical protein C8Q78DRAFT_1025880 [Trametes maxima]|nr:hypothetical protein C8Q78DRAFT_1025880 [Trametes maxima]